MTDLNKIKPKILGKSQAGQDAYIKAFFDVVENNKLFLEIGAFDGVQMSNTYYLRKNGWRGFLVDKYHGNHEINLFKTHLTKDNVFKMNNLWLQTYYKPPDFLSIDIDSMDYWILKELLKYIKPKLIQLEYNPNFTDSRTMKYDPDYIWDGSANFGASAMAFKNLLVDYKPIAFCKPHDLFFCLKEYDFKEIRTFPQFDKFKNINNDLWEMV